MSYLITHTTPKTMRGYHRRGQALTLCILEKYSKTPKTPGNTKSKSSCPRFTEFTEKC